MYQVLRVLNHNALRLVQVVIEWESDGILELQSGYVMMVGRHLAYITWFHNSDMLLPKLIAENKPIK